METFKTSGTWYPHTEKWPNRTVLVATVKEDRLICYQKKHVCPRAVPDVDCRHVEEQFIEGFTESEFKHRKEMKGTVELFCNYSPCSDCSQRLIEFQRTYPHLSITIICAQLYKVTTAGHVAEEEASKNRAGLGVLAKAGIVIKTLSPDVSVATPFPKEDGLELLRRYSGEEERKKRDVQEDEEEGKKRDVQEDEEEGKKRDVEGVQEEGKKKDVQEDEEEGKKKDVQEDEEERKKKDVQEDEEERKKKDVQEDEEERKKKDVQEDEEERKKKVTKCKWILRQRQRRKQVLFSLHSHLASGAPLHENN